MALLALGLCIGCVCCAPRTELSIQRMNKHPKRCVASQLCECRVQYEVSRNCRVLNSEAAVHTKLYSWFHLIRMVELPFCQTAVKQGVGATYGCALFALLLGSYQKFGTFTCCCIGTEHPTLGMKRCACIALAIWPNDKFA